MRAGPVECQIAKWASLKYHCSSEADRAGLRGWWTEPGADQGLCDFVIFPSSSGDSTCGRGSSGHWMKAIKKLRLQLLLLGCAATRQKCDNLGVAGPSVQGSVLGVALV